MNFIQNHFESLLHAHAFAFGIFSILFAFFFFAGGLVAANGETLGPSDSHVVSLYLDGVESTAPTRAQTVGEFIAKAGISVSPHDLVEPVANAKIDSDNFRVQIYRAKPVAIIDGNKVARVMTPHQTAKLIAEQAGIKVYPEDRLIFSTADNFITENLLGQKLTIERATPVVVSLYGANPIVYRTHAKTVGDFLQEKGIVPDSGATLSPNSLTPISPNLLISISKFGKKVINAEEEIPFGYETTSDPTKTIGVITVISPGRPGKKQIVYELDLKDGKEIGRRALQEVVVEEPTTQRQTRGTLIPPVASGDKTSWMRAAGLAESDFYYIDFVIGHESGWRPGAVNSSGCYGLGQACPGSKLVAACSNWQSDPVCQLRFFNGYAVNRYGGWSGAYSTWVRQGWW